MHIYDKIIFDCDSTLVAIEGLDELAQLKGKKAEVAELTRLSMDGKVKLEDVFSLKMAMIRPSKSDFEYLGNLYIKNLTEDIEETIKLLLELKKDILQMTGNFLPAVQILSRHLGIRQKNVYANKVYFNRKGDYTGFDSKNLLSVSGGKRVLVDKILQFDPKKNIAFVGDGSTDTETKPPVKLFIGFGGVIHRENIKLHSDIYISCKSIAPIVRFILNEDEQKIGECKHVQLFKKADRLIKNGYVYIKKQ
jgi:phosphoserine phosphatase